MNQTYKIGPSKSLKVYPGDKVDIEVWEYHEGTSGFGTTSTPLTTLITMVSGAFGGVSGGAGESGLIYNGVNSALNAFVPPGNQGATRPAAYLNYILFDQNYKVLNVGAQLAPATTFTKQKLSFSTLNIKEPGYVFVYLSYDNDSNNWVYFDDFKVTHTKSNVIQYNEYYPFGLQNTNSWTRENNSNNYLYNEGNELNKNSGWYETFFRGYDPALGRFNQIDPLAYANSSHTPYNYAYNDPVFYNDPHGDMPDEVLHIPRSNGSSEFSGDQGGVGFGYDIDLNGNPILDGWQAPSTGGYYGGYSPFRVGPGSPYDWMAPYRTVEMNAGLMSRRRFNSYYGIADRYGNVNAERRNQVAQQAATTAYWVTTDEGNFIYTDKSFQNLDGWYRAQAFERPAAIDIFQNDQSVLNALFIHFWAAGHRVGGDLHLRDVVTTFKNPDEKKPNFFRRILNYIVDYEGYSHYLIEPRTGNGVLFGTNISFTIQAAAMSANAVNDENIWRNSRLNEDLVLGYTQYDFHDKGGQYIKTQYQIFLGNKTGRNITLYLYNENTYNRLLDYFLK